MRKLLQSLRITFTLFRARTFGLYLHSGWNGDVEFAVYLYKGEEWFFPLTPIDPDRTFVHDAKS